MVPYFGYPSVPACPRRRATVIMSYRQQHWFRERGNIKTKFSHPECSISLVTHQFPLFSRERVTESKAYSLKCHVGNITALGKGRRETQVGLYHSSLVSSGCIRQGQRAKIYQQMPALPALGRGSTLSYIVKFRLTWLYQTLSQP